MIDTKACLAADGRHNFHPATETCEVCAGRPTDTTKPRQEVIEASREVRRRYRSTLDRLDDTTKPMPTENMTPCPDRDCHEVDGCPTELAVLQREWRRLTKRVAHLEQVALAAARAEERERCAKVAEGLIRDKGKSSSYREGWNHGCETAAIAIRKGE